MKFLMSLFLLSSVSAFSQSITLSDFNYPVRDIKEQGLTKETLYKSMNRSLVRHKDSICSNRAHVWAYEFEKKSQVTSPKIFLFFTPKNSRTGGWWTGVNWWYHVSPMVNEGGKFYVMDAGFPDRVKTPLLMKDWLAEFTGKDSKCKEIKQGEDDLIEHIWDQSAFPETTRYGKYDCYYKITPAGYWIPGQVAKHVLGKDETGRPIRLERDQIDKDEVYQACLEASTSPMGWAMGSGRSKCASFIDHGIL
jgi:hypothetical protein